MEPVEQGPLWQRVVFTPLYNVSYPRVPTMDAAFFTDERYASFVIQERLQAHPDLVRGLVHGLLEGNRRLREDGLKAALEWRDGLAPLVLLAGLAAHAAPVRCSWRCSRAAASRVVTRACSRSARSAGTVARSSSSAAWARNSPCPTRSAVLGGAPARSRPGATIGEEVAIVINGERR